MLHAVLYDKATGHLTGTRISRMHTDPAVLETVTTGVVAVAGGHPVFTQGVDRYRYQDGRIEPKTVLTFMATPTPFAADGTTECTITCEPPDTLTVLVEGEAVMVSPADPTIVLTSDTPQTFTITLAPHLLYWAAPITVEAT